MDVSIRPYQPSDYPEFASNLKEADMLHLPWDSIENVDKKHKKDPELILTAIVDSRLVGSLIIMEDGWGAFIYRFVIKKEYRNKGVGTKLLQATEELLKKRNVEQVCLWMDEEDKELFNFYQKRGYSSGVKRLLMIKTLS